MKVNEVIDLDEGWKDKVASAAIAGGIALGGGAGMAIKDKIGSMFGSDEEPAKTSQTVPDVTQQRASQPVPQPVSKPVTQPVAAKAEPAPFDPASNKELLIKTAKKMGMHAVNDLASLLGQVQVETAGWTRATENFNYTDPTRIYRVFTSNFPSPESAKPYVGNQVALANRALANRNGNGDEASGDGYKYRGRGFIHLTGKGLYAEAGKAVHPENPNIYVNRPELISSNPAESAKVAVWYFLSKVGKGKTHKQASNTVNPAGLKQAERGQAAMAMRKHLTTMSAKPRK